MQQIAIEQSSVSIGDLLSRRSPVLGSGEVTGRHAGTPFRGCRCGNSGRQLA